MFFFFIKVPAHPGISPLSLPDALPIWKRPRTTAVRGRRGAVRPPYHRGRAEVRFVTADRKSTRLNSSHSSISYAVFCLKKKRPIKLDRNHVVLIESNPAQLCSVMADQR